MTTASAELHVPVPREIADRYGIEPGERLGWLAAGDAIRVVPRSARLRADQRARRLILFDLATERQERRQSRHASVAGGGRLPARDELPGRGRAG